MIYHVTYHIKKMITSKIFRRCQIVEMIFMTDWIGICGWVAAKIAV